MTNGADDAMTDTEGRPLPMTPAEIAAVCHEANRAYCVAIGDTSQSSWDDAPMWQRTSAINGVLMHQGHPEATPENSHESWLKEKADTGWKYGPVKNADTREHPCFMPYAQLPISQRRKDALFRAIVHALKD